MLPRTTANSPPSSASPRRNRASPVSRLRGWASASSKSANCGANALNQRPARSVGR